MRFKEEENFIVTTLFFFAVMLFIGIAMFFLTANGPTKKTPTCTVTYDSTTNTLSVTTGEEGNAVNLVGGVSHEYVVSIHYGNRSMFVRKATGDSRGTGGEVIGCVRIGDESWKNVRFALGRTGNLVGIPFTGQGELYLF